VRSAHLADRGKPIPGAQHAIADQFFSFVREALIKNHRSTGARKRTWPTLCALGIGSQFNPVKKVFIVTCAGNASHRMDQSYRFNGAMASNPSGLA
jgi:hypothetical protein